MRIAPRTLLCGKAWRIVGTVEDLDLVRVDRNVPPMTSTLIPSATAPMHLLDERRHLLGVAVVVRAPGHLRRLTAPVTARLLLASAHA